LRRETIFRARSFLSYNLSMPGFHPEGFLTVQHAKCAPRARGAAWIARQTSNLKVMGSNVRRAGVLPALHADNPIGPVRISSRARFCRKAPLCFIPSGPFLLIQRAVWAKIDPKTTDGEAPSGFRGHACSHSVSFFSLISPYY